MDEELPHRIVAGPWCPGPEVEAANLASRRELILNGAVMKLLMDGDADLAQLLELAEQDAVLLRRNLLGQLQLFDVRVGDGRWRPATAELFDEHWSKPDELILRHRWRLTSRLHRWTPRGLIGDLTKRQTLTLRQVSIVAGFRVLEPCEDERRALTFALLSKFQRTPFPDVHRLACEGAPDPPAELLFAPGSLSERGPWEVLDDVGLSRLDLAWPEGGVPPAFLFRLGTVSKAHADRLAVPDIA